MANSQESNATLEDSRQAYTVAPSPPRPDRITRWLLIAIGIYPMAVFLPFPFVVLAAPVILLR